MEGSLTTVLSEFIYLWLVPQSYFFQFQSLCIFHSANNDREGPAELLLSTSESLEEMEKLNFICSCIIDSVKAGGSVLIPIGRLGTILQLLELISLSLEASSLKVNCYIFPLLLSRCCGNKYTRTCITRN